MKDFNSGHIDYPDFNKREETHITQKQKLAKRTAEIIAEKIILQYEEASIFLGAGSTIALFTEEFLAHLDKTQQLTVLTNNLAALQILLQDSRAKNNKWKLHIYGDEVDPNNHSLKPTFKKGLGEFLKQNKTQIAVISCGKVFKDSNTFFFRAYESHHAEVQSTVISIDDIYTYMIIDSSKRYGRTLTKNKSKALDKKRIFTKVTQSEVPPNLKVVIDNVGQISEYTNDTLFNALENWWERSPQYDEERKQVYDSGVVNMSIVDSTIVGLNINPNIGLMKTNIKTLYSKGEKESKLASGMEKIVEAIEKSNEILDERKMEIFRILDLLSEEAVKPRNKRKNGGVKLALKTLQTFLDPINSISGIWQVFRPIIMSFFE